MRVERTFEFARWLDSIEDDLAFASITRRIQRLEKGAAGDAAPVGGGVSELRIHVGAGWRAYYVRHEDAYVMLCGGTKRTQAKDIKRARTLAAEL